MSRNWSKLHRQVCFGESGGRIIWQPRIGCWFHDKRFEGEPFPPPFTGMNWLEVYRELDCSARLYSYFNACFKATCPESVRVTTHRLNETDVETRCETPVGTLTSISRSTPHSRAQLRLKREVITEADLKIAIWRAEHTTWQWDQEIYDHGLAEAGDLGAPTMYIPRVTVQDLYINLMGTQDGIYAIYDWPDTVKAYFGALDACHDRLIDAVIASPIDIINFGDNVHCGTLPPDLFREYVLPSYQRRCEKLHAAGKFVHSHWDGDTKALLPFVKETGLDGIEAITPQPQGDVTLAEIKAHLGDTHFLIDGIPAVYFDETFSVAVLEDCVHRLIELFAPRLILGISDEISSTGDIERIRTVGRIVDAYNASCA